VAEAEAAEGAFAAYDRWRRLRIETQIGDRGMEALRLLPLLLHVNHPGLPGHVEDPTCPCGIAEYSPSPGDIALAQRHFPGGQVRRAGVLRPVVDVVAVMGSAGTIGFSGESDLDVWVCHRSSLTGPSLDLYRTKVQAVERWLNESSGFEIHLFLQPTDRIRDNDFGETDVEGCGSAMGALLKEEFYRTGVLLAGKVPFWRVVPPGAGADGYCAHVERLCGAPGFHADAYVDLGWVARVPLGELFGAVVWQIVKGWKSPFKSALKMGLLESAVRAGQEGPSLCEVLKEEVLRGERVDPYRLLFDQVLAHYRANGESNSQDLLARCFYLKTGVRLDSSPSGKTPRRQSDQAVLAEYVASWGWGSRRITHLNDFHAWKFEWVHALAREVDRFFLRTYQRIRAALDESGETQRITPRDLTILGRKLQAVYRRVPHKVETLHLITRGVEEATVSLYQEMQPDGELPWRLYRGRATPLNVDAKEADLFRTSADAVDLLVWAAQNKIVGARTRIFCHGIRGEMSAADLEALGQMLAAFVASVDREDRGHEALLEPPRVTRLLAIPSFLADTSGDRGLGAVYATTWGETYYQRWDSADALRAFLEESFIPFLLESPSPQAVEVFAPPRKVGTAQASPRRLQRELPAAAAFLGGSEHPADLRRRLVGAAEPGFYVLDRVRPGEIRYRTFPDRQALVGYLSAVGPHGRVETRVEGVSGDLAMTRTLFETALPGVLDVFLLDEPQWQTLFVVDEVGNLTSFSHAPEEVPYALAKLLVFLEGIFPELASQAQSPLRGKTLTEALRIHTLLVDGACRVLTATHEYLGKVRALGLRPVGLTIEKMDGAGGPGGGYRITWGSQRIESGEFENPLAEVRQRIRQARSSRLDYDVFVTRLFLDERFTAECCGPFVATGHYLFYKKVIEQRLSR
jgi:adenylate cyclase class 1